MDTCVFAGMVASVATQILKRIPVVQKYPKVVAALLTGAYAVSVGTGFECWLSAFAASVAGYEVVLKPLTRKEGE
jgi:hypothetical protein